MKMILNYFSTIDNITFFTNLLIKIFIYFFRKIIRVLKMKHNLNFTLLLSNYLNFLIIEQFE